MEQGLITSEPQKMSIFLLYTIKPGLHMDARTTDENRDDYYDDKDDDEEEEEEKDDDNDLPLIRD